MATLTNLNKGLTSETVRDVGKGASFQAATYHLDGQPPVRLDIRVEPELLGVDEDGNVLGIRASVRFGNLLDHPEVADQVIEHEKAALLAKKAAGAVSSKIQDRTSPDGSSPEWDHFAFTLSREETAWLSDHPEKEARFLEIVTDALRSHPMSPGTRQALVTDIHKDTGAWHVQALVNRYAIDYSQQPPFVPTAVDVSNTSYMSKITRMAQEALTAEGFPIVVSRTFKDDPEKTSARSISEDRNTSDDAKQAYRDDVQAAGGIPGARSTIGPVPESQSTTQAISSLSPEISTLETGAQLAEADGLKSAQLVEQLRAQLIAAESARTAAAQRRATFDQAIAAIGQRDIALESERIAREAEAVAVAERGVALEQLAEAEVAIAAQATRADGAETEVARLAPLLETAREDLARLDGIVQSEPARQAEAVSVAVAPLREYAAAEPVRQAQAVQEAVAPLHVELEQMRQALAAETSAKEAVVAELDEDRRTFVDRAREWATEHVAAPLVARAETAEAALREARDTIAAFPGKLEAEVSRQLQAMETRIQNTFDRILAAAEERFSVALQARDTIIDTLRAAAAAPVAAVAAAAGRVAEATGGAAAAVEGAQRTRVPRPGSDYATLPPGQWSPAQSAYAQRVLDNAISTNRIPAGTGLDVFGKQMHDNWLQKNPPAPDPETTLTTRRPK